jgi:hypothetical protein
MKTLYTLIACSAMALSASVAFAQNDYATRENQADSSTAVLEKWEQEKAEEQLENLKQSEKVARREERRASKELKEKRKALKAEQRAQKARKKADRLARKAERD